jgi:hypothetical protein
VDIVEEAIARYPAHGNLPRVNPEEEYVYYSAKRKRARWANS